MWMIALFLLGLPGCKTPEDHVEEADEEVYNILDQKWQDDFGYKANYKLTDMDPNAPGAVSMVPPSGVLSLAEAVAIATNYNRSYLSQKEDLYTSALSLTLVRHEYAAQWFGTVDATYVYNNGNEETTLDTQVGVEQQFLFGDALLIGAGLTTDWFRFLTGDPETSLTSVLSATASAPLLGVGQATLRREELTQAERNVLYRIRNFNRFRQDFVVTTISDYYRVLQQRSRVEIQNASFKSIEASTNQIRMEFEVGQNTANAYGEAQQRLLEAEQQKVTRLQDYERALDVFKITLALPTDLDVQLDPNELRLLELIGISEPNYPEDEAIEMALNLRLDLANVRDSLVDAERQLVLAAKGLGPQVEFIASANVDSTPDTEFLRLRFHEGLYRTGIAADLGLDQKSERNAYRRSLIDVQRQQRSYDEEIDNIKLEVRDSYRNLLQTAESYRIQKLGVELAQKRVEEQKIRLQYGSGDVRQLMDSENSLVNAQDALVNALVDHLNAKLRFFRDVGILRVLPDGMWEQANL